MRIEASQNMIPQSILTTARKIALPLYDHKLESDRAGKHTEWSPRKHTVLTTLAILTDLGFDLATAILFFSGNRWGSAGLKVLHNAGAEIIPQAVTDLRNRIKSTNKFN